MKKIKHKSLNNKKKQPEKKIYMYITEIKKNPNTVEIKILGMLLFRNDLVNGWTKWQL